MKTAAFVVSCIVVTGVGGIAVQSASATLFDVTMALNPVGYWNFETNNITDHSGNGNDLTMFGDALLIGGGPAVADSTNAGDLFFNFGTDGFYVDTPGGPGGNALNWTGNTFSINSWVNLGDGPSDFPLRTRAVITKQRIDPWQAVPVTSWDYALWLELIHEPDLDPPFQRFRLNSYPGDGFGVTNANTNGGFSTADLLVGEWHMITVSADAGTATLYYDGQPMNPGGSPIAGAATGGTPAYSRFWIGTHTGPTNGFQGLVDEASVYTTALSAAQVSCLYTGSCDPGPVPGDFDDDGDVDGDDFLVWQTGFGTIYDGDDFLIWQQNFPTPGSGTGSGAVPEPTSLALLVLLGLGAAVRRMKNG